jgi:RHS repeat-associated protein
MNINKAFQMPAKEANLLSTLALTLLVCFLLITSQDALALTKPTLLSPANNADITTSSVTFSWSHPYNDQYELKIKTSGGTLKYASGKISSKSKTVNLSSIPLTYGSTYKWYVVVYANGQEDSSADSWFTYKFTGRVDVSGGVNVSPSTVTVGQDFTVSFDLKEFQGGAKTFEYVELWIQDGAGNDLYPAQRWDNVAFSANEQRSFSATTSLDPARGRGAGDYRAIVRGKVAGDSPFNFGVVDGSGAVNPRTFTAKIDSVVPGSVSVTPDSGSWTDSPHDLSVTSSNATIIYYTMVNTYNGSTPSDPATPSPSSNNGSISGPSGTFRLFASSGQLKRSKLRFIGCNNTVCGSASSVFSFEQNLVDGSDPPNTPPATTTYGSNTPSGNAAEPVNTATGNYYYQHTDLKLPGRGLSFAFTRTYNDQDSTSGPLGWGWTHSYNVHLAEQADSSVVVKQGDGREETYDPDGGGSYHSRYPGHYSRLVKNADNSFTLTAKDQIKQKFGTDGRLTAIGDRNGNALGFAYDNTGNLSTITDTVGRTFNLSYDANNHLVQLTDPIGRKVLYTYDADGHLISDTDPVGSAMSYVYDANHHVIKITDRRGHTLVENIYDDQGRVVSQKNGRGFTTTFAYDSPNVGDTTITDPLGDITVHTHDKQRRLIRETDGLGHAVQYVYDANNNRTQITDKNGNVTSFIYDSQGNVTLKSIEPNQVTSIEYDSFNNPTRRVDALNQATIFEYDAKGNLTKVTDPLDGSTAYTYDGFGQQLTVTDALGRITTNAYDTQGNLITVADALGHETTWAYDGAGRRLSVTDTKGRITSFAYDANDRLLGITDPLGNQTTTVYDANGNRTRVTDARSGATSFAYDANDLLISVTDALGGVIAYSYDNADHRIAVTDARGNTTTFAYDAAGRMSASTDALGKATQFAYDANGNLIQTINPLGHATTFAYDALDRRTGVTDALDHTTLSAYDALGRLIARTDAKNRVTSYVYDALGRLTQVTDTANGEITYTYDAVGNRLSFTDPNGHTSTYSYDDLNRLAVSSDPLGQTYHFAYDEAGNLVERIDAKNQKVSYQYDGNNRLIRTDYPNNRYVLFEYDANGNRTQIVDDVGMSTYTYDALNRLSRSTDGYGQNVGYEYDAAGNRTALVYPDGKRVNYTYDANNRMTTVTDWLGGITIYGYDATGNLATTINPNSTQANYAYDNAERLIQLTNAKPDASILASYTLTLDDLGNRTGIDRSEPLALAPVAQSHSYAYDADNRLTSVNGMAIRHDANGNLTAGPNGDYLFDSENRLVNAPGYLYVYDGLGRRLQRTNYLETTRYALDVGVPQTQVLTESDGAGSPKAYYVYGLGLISRITPAGEARYYHYDPLGSTVALTDLNGQTTDRYAYDPFGVPLASDGGTPNPFRYVGQYGLMHEGNGLYFVRARYYDPAPGRFISKDPLPGQTDDSQGLHRYVYGGNNPVRFVDVSGLSAKESGGTSDVNRSSNEMPEGYYAFGRWWRSKKSADNYRRALQQISTNYLAEAAVNNQIDADLAVMEQSVRLLKTPIDVTMDFASIAPGSFGLVGKAYGFADTAVNSGWALYQASKGQLKTSDALKLVADLGIGLLDDKIVVSGSEFATKALIYETFTIPTEFGFMLYEMR